MFCYDAAVNWCVPELCTSVNTATIKQDFFPREVGPDTLVDEICSVNMCGLVVSPVVKWMAY